MRRNAVVLQVLAAGLLWAGSAYGQCDFSPSGTLGPLPIAPTDIPLTPTGGTPPYTFSYANGAMPIPGFRVSNAPAVPSTNSPSQTGTLVGLPLNPSQTALTSNSTTIHLADSAGCTVDKTVTLQFSPVDIVSFDVGQFSPSGIVSPDNGSGVQGYAAGDTPQYRYIPVGGVGPYTFSVTAGALPTGLGVDPSSGDITGTITASGNFTFDLRVQDSAGNSLTRTFQWFVSPLRISNAGNRILPNASVNVPYSFTFLASGGTGGPYTFSAFGVPQGLTLSPAGVLSGTPSSSTFSPFPINLTVNDGTNSNFVVFALTVLPAAPTGLSLSVSSFRSSATSATPDFQAGANATLNFSAAGGIPPYTFDLAGSSLPPGAFLTPGVLNTPNTAPAGSYFQGRVRAPGSYTFTFRATDNVGAQVSGPFAWNFSALGMRNANSTGAQPAYISGGVSLGVLGVALSVETVPYGGIPPYTITSSDLPQGLSIDSNGQISGVPQEAGSPLVFNVAMADSSPTPLTFNTPVFISIASGTPATLTINGGDLGTITVNTSYTHTIQVYGGTPSPNYTVNILSGSLPPGLMLLGTGAFNNGGSVNNAFQIAGTPTTNGLYEVLVQVIDGAGNLGQRRIRLRVSDLAITTTSLPNGTVGQPYSQSLAASGGATPYTFSIVGGALPTGLSLNASTGLISGTPTGAGASVTFQVTDAAGFSTSRGFFLTISDGLAFVTTSLPNGTLGQAYSQSLAASGGTGPYTFSIIFGALPTGLSLNAATGLISGTPTGAGASVTFQVTDAAGFSTSRGFFLTITDGLVFVTTSLPNGTLGQAYSQSLVASGGTGPYTYSVTGLVLVHGQSGILPAGLSLNASTGLISGTPTSGGGTIVFQVKDSAGFSVTANLTLTITDGLAFVTTLLPNGTLGQPYSQSVVASGGAPPYSFSVFSGTLPTGLSLNASTGLISGTPTRAGGLITFQVTDSAGIFVYQSVTLTITDGLVFVTTSLPNGTLGQPYSQSLVASGGAPPYTFSVTAGTRLPTGLSLNPSTGLISGTLSGAGSSNIFFQVTDSGGFTAGAVFTITDGLAFVTPSGLPSAALGQAYSQSIVVSGGMGPYTFSTCCGNPPQGVSINTSTGLLSGTPTVSGIFLFDVTVTDAIGFSATSIYGVTVTGGSLAFTTTSLAAGITGQPYSQTLTASGGTPPYTFFVSGSLPAGLSLNQSTGLISGTPPASSSSTVSFVVADSAGDNALGSFTLIISAFQITDNNVLPLATFGRNYSFTFHTSVAGSYTWSIFGGSFPPSGMTLNSSTGVFSGTPGFQGVSQFQVIATSTAGSVTKSFTFFADTLESMGNLTLPTLSPFPLLVGAANTTNNLLISGGIPPYTVSLLSGALPPGMTLTPGPALLGGTPQFYGYWLIIGTPTTVGNYSFRVHVADSSGLAADRTLSLRITGLSAVTTTLPTAVYGTAYSASLTGATSVALADLPNNAPPPGLTLSPTGLLSGTPAATGSYPFTVEYTTGADTRRVFLNLTINATAGVAALNVSSPGALSSDISAGRSLSLTYIPSGGTAPYNWSITAGALPPGLSLQTGTPPTASIAGVLTTPGTFTWAVRVDDSSGKFAVRQTTVTVSPIRSALAVATQFGASDLLPAGRVGDPYSFDKVCVNGTPPCVYSTDAANTLLPAGIQFSSAGVLSGTPTEAGNFVLVYSVTDAGGNTLRSSLTFEIFPAGANVGVNGLSGAVRLESATAGSPYSFNLEDLLIPGQGARPIAWTIDSGALPAGLSIAPGTGTTAATLAGTASVTGNYTFTLVATDANGRQYLLSGGNMAVSSVGASPSTLPEAVSGVSYSQTLTASGGSAPYLFRLTSTSEMPPGMTLSAAGVLSGTPSTVTDDPFQIEVEAVDSLGSIFFRRYALAVNVSNWADGTIPAGGGTVADVLFPSAEVIAPPGVIPADTSASINVVDPGGSLMLPPGFNAADSYFVQVQLTPQPAFPLPAPGATLVLPLLVQQMPGTVLSLFFRDGTDTLVPALDTSGNPITGTVDASGLTATFVGLSHFSTFAALHRSPLPPVIVPTLSPAPNANGWNNTNVTVSWSVTDPSGIASSAGCDTTGLAAETAGTTLTCAATNGAGIPGSVSVTVRIDRTAPTISFGSPSPAANAAGWNTSNVSVPFTGSDSLSGVDSTSVASPIVFSVEGSALNSTVTITDKAGNSATFTTPAAIKIDRTPPSITAAATTSPNGAGWYNTNVVIHFTCLDALSGIPAGACPADQTLSTEGAAVSSTAATVADAAGNMSAPSNVVTVKIDKTPPALNPVVNPDPVLLNGLATASAGAADALSGLASQSCGAVVTSSTGTKSVTCTATDNAGNTKTGATNYLVTTSLSGAVTVQSGQSFTFTGGTIGGLSITGGAAVLNGATAGGNVTMSGGSLVLNAGTISGNLTVSGGSVVFTGASAVHGNMTASGAAINIGPGAAINGNLGIQSIPSGAGASQVCGATVRGNLTVQSNASQVLVGSAGCAGNQIGGNSTILSNTAPVQVVNNTISGNLNCTSNTSIAGSGNTAAKKEGQCSAF